MYRTNCPPPPEPHEPKEVVPFKKRHPIPYKIGRTILGAVTTVIAGWLLFPGVTMVGRWSSHNWYGFTPFVGAGNCIPYWFVGLATLVVIPVTVVVSIFVGKEIETALD